MAQSMRWQFRDPMLLWLFVPAYLAHLAEEYFGGFTRWVGLATGRPLRDAAFVAINAVALVAMIAAIREASRREERGWMAIAVATVLFTNAVAHLAGSLMLGSYSPGLITGIVLYVPIAGLALLRAWHQAPADRFRLGVVAGLAAHALVFVTALALRTGTAVPHG